MSSTSSKIPRPTAKSKHARPRSDSSSTSRQSSSKSRPPPAEPKNDDSGLESFWSRVETTKIPTQHPTDIDDVQNVKDEEIFIHGERNLLKISALVEKVSREENVIEVAGDLEKKFVLSYKHPPKPPVSRVGAPQDKTRHPPKPEKKRKPRMKVKSKGMGTDPPPITVNSGTWTTPITTNTQPTLTTPKTVQSQAVQSDSPKSVPMGTMTPTQPVAAVGVSAVPDYADKCNAADSDTKPVLVNRSVGEVILPPPIVKPTDADSKPKPAVISTGMNHKPAVEHKSACTVHHTKTQASVTDRLETGSKEVSAVPETRDNSCCTIHSAGRAKSVQAVQLCRVRYSSTSDLCCRKDTGVSTVRAKLGAVSTMTEKQTRRHMAVGTKNTDKKKMGQLEGQLFEMQKQHNQILKMTKQVLKDEEQKRRNLMKQKPPTGRKPRKRTSNLTSSCSYSTWNGVPDKFKPNTICSCLLCKHCCQKIDFTHDKQGSQQPVKAPPPLNRRRVHSAFISNSAISPLCPDECRCDRCFAITPVLPGRTSLPIKKCAEHPNRPRRRIHSKIILPVPEQTITVLPDIVVSDIVPPALVTVSVNKKSTEHPNRPRRRIHSMILLESEMNRESLLDYPIYRGRSVRVRTPSNYCAL